MGTIIFFNILPSDKKDVFSFYNSWDDYLQRSDTITLRSYSFLGTMPFLENIWGGKYTAGAQPFYMPVAEKSEGCAVGAIFEKVRTKPDSHVSGKKWLGKAGMGDNTDSSEMSIQPGGEKSLMRVQGVRDAIREKISSDLYQVLGNDRYIVPKVRLAKLPIENEFTRKNPILLPYLEKLNENRLSTLTEATYLMSKYVDGYHDLITLIDCLDEEDHNFKAIEEIIKQGRVPQQVRIGGDGGKIVPIVGIIEMLAVSRLLSDTDVLGGGLRNAGYIIERDIEGNPTQIRAVKIDTGFSFNFSGEINKLAASFNPAAVKGRLVDKRDLQYGNNQPIVIKWELLSDAQKESFLSILDKGLNILRQPEFMEFVVRRDGYFSGIRALTPGAIAILLKGWEKWLSLQEQVYDKELTSYATNLDTTASTVINTIDDGGVEESKNDDAQHSEIFGTEINPTITQRQSSILPILQSDLPEPIDNFVGRIAELEQLHKLHDSGNQIVIISAFGGTGKSEMALKYGHIRLEEGCVVRKFRGGNIVSGYREIGNELGLYIRDKTPEEVRIIINHKLTRITDESGELGATKLLFIFDNLDHGNIVEAEEYIDSLPKNIKLVITTRDPDLGSDLRQVPPSIELKEFSEVEALEYAQKTLRMEKKGVLALTKVIGTLPLRLSLAFATLMNDDTLDLADYIAYYERMKKAGKANPEIEIVLGQLFKKGVEGEAGWKLLQYLANLDPDFVPMDIFKNWDVITKDELYAATKALKSLSLVRVTFGGPGGGNRGFKFHRFIRDEAKEYATSHSGVSIPASVIVTNLIVKLEQLFPQVSNMPDESWDAARLYAASIRVIIDETKLIDGGLVTPQLAAIMDRMGEYSKEVEQDFQVSLKYELRALELKKLLWPEQNHPDVASSLNDVGIAYKALGDAAKALRFQEEALEMRRAIYPGNHPSVATILNNVGGAYWNLGDKVKARLLFEECYLMRKELYGEDDEKTQQSLQDIKDCDPSYVVAKVTIKYDNPILNNAELINKAITCGDTRLLDLLLDLGQDKEIAESLLSSIAELGYERSFALLLGYDYGSRDVSQVHYSEAAHLHMDKYLTASSSGTIIADTSFAVVHDIDTAAGKIATDPSLFSALAGDHVRAAQSDSSAAQFLREISDMPEPKDLAQLENEKYVPAGEEQFYTDDSPARSAISAAGAGVMKAIEVKESITYLFTEIIPLLDKALPPKEKESFLSKEGLWIAAHLTGGVAFSFALPSSESISIWSKAIAPVSASSSYALRHYWHQEFKYNVLGEDYAANPLYNIVLDAGFAALTTLPVAMMTGNYGLMLPTIGQGAAMSALSYLGASGEMSWTGYMIGNIASLLVISKNAGSILPSEYNHNSAIMTISKVASLLTAVTLAHRVVSKVVDQAIETVGLDSWFDGENRIEEL